MRSAEKKVALETTAAIGVDEAGRGPWAGPVVVAAVRLAPGQNIPGLDDSKALSEIRRDVLFQTIQQGADAWSIQFITAGEIDASDILRATFEGMRRAVEAIARPGDTALIDGPLVPPKLVCPARGVIGGDATVAAIAAASILAKVARDAYMVELDTRWPGYGFARHKGYGTAAHRAALQRLGACPEHRFSFKPIRALTPLA